MAPAVVAFVVVSALVLLFAPRRWASLALIAGACYVTRAQAIEIGAATITVIMILITTGILRVLVRGERIRGGLSSLDWLMICWGLWMVVSVAFHERPATLINLRVRNVYEAWGLYFLFRTFCQSRAEIWQLAKVLAIVLVPIGTLMLVEKVTGANAFAQLGGVPAFSAIRDGVVRAQGPFSHPILAGTVGGVSVALVVALWKRHRFMSLLGSFSCLAMVFASGSSGPILATGAGLGVLMLWPFRENMRLVRWGAVFVYLGLEVVMTQPAYFIMEYIDITGGSTSWYRAQLIRMAIEYLNEWWLVGTDYTRHWMPTGIPGDPNSADIVNHFIAMGVAGGLLLMGLFISLLVKAFWHIGHAFREAEGDESFLCWAVGASLFSHAVTCLSVSYYDDSVLFLYLTIALSVACLSKSVATVSDPVPAPAGAGRSRYERVPRYAGFRKSTPALEMTARQVGVSQADAQSRRRETMQSFSERRRSHRPLKDVPPSRH